MTTFKISHRNSKAYLYAFCGCGEISKVPAALMQEYASADYSQRISQNVKRGIEAARKRGVQLGRPARRSYGHHTHKGY